MSATTKPPILTLILISLAILASASPVLADWLVWDRAAIAAGQWWRLITGHFVHFSLRHLICDALAVGVAGWLIETRAQQSLAFVVLAAALAIDVTIALMCPAVRFYGGLSGIAYAMWGYLVVLGIAAGARAQWASVAILALLAGKIGLEWAGGRAMLAGEGFVVLPVVHAAGAICGAAKGVMRS